MASCSPPAEVFMVFLLSGGVRGATGVSGDLRKPMCAGGGTCLPRDAMSVMAVVECVGNEDVRGVIGT